MITLQKRYRFEASHILPLHTGKCGRLHGHSWQMVVVVESETLQTEGSQTDMVMDYGVISEVVKPIVEKYLDHWHLNDTTGLANPTSERLAIWLFDKIKPALPLLVAILVEETCTSQCHYRP